MNCFIQDDFGDERETNLAAVIAASSSSGQSDIVSHTSASMNILLNDVILCCFLVDIRNLNHQYVFFITWFPLFRVVKD
jgi:hypothetical protein